MPYAYSLAVLALAPILVGNAALANQPCFSCKKKAPAKAPPKIEYRDKLIPAPYAQPVVYVPSYTATINPSNTYNTTVTVTTPPAQQSLQVVVPPPPIVAGLYAAPGVAPSPVQAVAGESELVSVLRDLAVSTRTMNDRLCAVEKAVGIQKAPTDSLPVKVPVPVRPFARLAVGTCAKCHDATVAASDGKGFVLTVNGVLRDLNAEEKLKALKYIRALKCPPQPNKHSLPALTAAVVADVTDDLMKP